MIFDVRCEVCVWKFGSTFFMGIDCVSRVGMDPNCEIKEEFQWCQTKNSVLETIRDDYFVQNEMVKNDVNMSILMRFLSMRYNVFL